MRCQVGIGWGEVARGVGRLGWVVLGFRGWTDLFYTGVVVRVGLARSTAPTKNNIIFICFVNTVCKPIALKQK